MKGNMLLVILSVLCLISQPPVDAQLLMESNLDKIEPRADNEGLQLFFWEKIVLAGFKVIKCVVTFRCWSMLCVIGTRGTNDDNFVKSWNDQMESTVKAIEYIVNYIFNNAGELLDYVYILKAFKFW